MIGSISPDPDGGGTLKHRAVRNTYDSSTGLLTRVEQGNVDSQSDAHWAAFSPAQAVETVYDANARPVVRKLVSGGAVHALGQTSYDALGRPECTAQRMNPAVFGTVTATPACALGTQGSGTDDHGPDRIAKSFYDAAGRAYQVKTAFGVTGQEADEGTRTFTANGPVESVTDAEGNRTTYEYDGHDRLAKTYFSLPSPKGNPFFVAEHDHLVTGEITAIRENGAASGIGVIGTIAYDNLGRRTSLTLGNGVATLCHYDAASRLDELKLDFAGSADDLTSSFAYNPAGQIASNARSNDACAWTRLGSGTTTTAANGLNQLGSWVSTLGYDSRGNLTGDGTYA